MKVTLSEQALEEIEKCSARLHRKVIIALRELQTKGVVVSDCDPLVLARNLTNDSKEKRAIDRLMVKNGAIKEHINGADQYMVSYDHSVGGSPDTRIAHIGSPKSDDLLCYTKDESGNIKVDHVAETHDAVQDWIDNVKLF